MTWDGNDCMRRFIQQILNENSVLSENIESYEEDIATANHSIEVCKNCLEDNEFIISQLKEVLKRNGFPYKE